MKGIFTLKTPFALFIILSFFRFSAIAQELIWSDEFEGSSIDTSKWLYETNGLGNTDGELQQYTASSNNAYIQNGNLVIEAKRESSQGKQFTSAQLTTLDKFSFRYGVLETRMKVPNVANGLWPALRMMGNTYKEVGSPKCGRTSIMEMGWKDALNQGIANRSVHAGSRWWHEQGTRGDWLQADYTKQLTIDNNFFEDYHIFKLEWTPTKMIVSVDGNPFYEVDITDPNVSELVDNSNFLILNLAVGGSYFVQITDPNAVLAPFPAKMNIDYIRLFKNEYTEIFDGRGVVNSPPVANINMSTIKGRAPLQVSFDASKSYDTNNDPLTYSWDFGNGKTSTEVTTNYTFTQKGTYTVQLTVSDGKLTHSTSHLIEVTDEFESLKSSKRGLAYGYHSQEDMAALSPGISWWYNWGTQPDTDVSDIHLQYGIDYVPMAWDGGFREQEIIDWLQNHPEAKYILGWNEPNFIKEANMTPSRAAAEWPRLENIARQFGLKIVSPALNFCADCVAENGVTYTDPIQYFDDFFNACSGCQVDAIAIHAYMGTIEAFEWYIGIFKKYNRPIWMTEFCNWENSPTLEDQKRFLIHSIDYMENDPQIERYAWFIGRNEGPPYMNLLEPQSGVLSELGELYINMPVHDPSTFTKIPAMLEAENYSSMQGVRLESTTDTKGFLHVSEMETGDHVEYSVSVEKEGNYKFVLRITGAPSNSEIQLLVDGVYSTTANMNTNGEQQWADQIMTATLPTGKHKVRFQVITGSLNLNYINVQETITANPACSSSNAALHKFAEASSTEGTYNPSNTVDGNKNTRWSSDFTNNEWLRVDLGSMQNICKVSLTWEAAYGSRYELRLGTSTDIAESTIIATVANGNGETDEVETDPSISGRYCWMKGSTRGTPWGYSIWEMEIYTMESGVKNLNTENIAQEFEDFTLSPNPAYGEISVDASNYKEGDYFEIISIEGKVVEKQLLNQQKTVIDISKLTAGMYIIKYEGSISQTKKFVKQ